MLIFGLLKSYILSDDINADYWTANHNFLISLKPESLVCKIYPKIIAYKNEQDNSPAILSINKDIISSDYNILLVDQYDQIRIYSNQEEVTTPTGEVNEYITSECEKRTIFPTILNLNIKQLLDDRIVKLDETSLEFISFVSNKYKEEK